MSELKLFKLLAEHKIDTNEIAVLSKFQSRDGFVVVDDDDLDGMMAYFKDFDVYKGLVPVLTDNNSNYLCIYVDGPMKGMVCDFQHDELDLAPKFRNLHNLITTIEKNPEAYDMYDLDQVNQADFPKLMEVPHDVHDREIINQLVDTFKNETAEDLRQQIAYCLMNLTAHTDLQSLYPFLDHEDMYIQARSIQIMGTHRHEPILEKIIQLQTTAQHNGQTAAKSAVKKIKGD